MQQHLGFTADGVDAPEVVSQRLLLFQAVELGKGGNGVQKHHCADKSPEALIALSIRLDNGIASYESRIILPELSWDGDVKVARLHCQNRFIPAHRVV